MSDTNNPSKSETSITSLPDGLIALIKFARPIVVLAAIFYLVVAISVLINPEQVAREALGADFTAAQLQVIQVTGAVFLVASLIFFYSAKLLKPASTLRQLRLASILALVSALITIGGSRNAFSLLLLLIIIVPIFMIAVQSHKLLQQKSD